VKILDNLKELHEIFKVTRENISFTPTKLSTIIKHIDRVEADNAALKRVCFSLIGRVNDVEETNKSYALQDNILRKYYEESGDAKRFTWSGWLLKIVRENAALKARVARMEDALGSAFDELNLANDTTFEAWKDELIARRAGGE